MSGCYETAQKEKLQLRKNLYSYFVRFLLILFFTKKNFSFLTGQSQILQWISTFIELNKNITFNKQGNHKGYTKSSFASTAVPIANTTINSKSSSSSIIQGLVAFTPTIDREACYLYYLQDYNNYFG